MYGSRSSSPLSSTSAVHPTGATPPPPGPSQAAHQANSQTQTPAAPKRPRRITVRTLRRMKENNNKITMLTAYDAPFAKLLDQAGVEMLLVGDSLGMVLQGANNTLSVTMDHMVYHTRCVSHVAERSFVVGDMPFMSYQVSPEQALLNAGRLVQEGGAHAVKLEGGQEMASTIQKITNAGIPVVGHIGLTPQSVNALGGFVIQGRTPEQAERLKQDALAVQASGAFCVVLEGIPRELAQEITALLDIPTIGIGAGEGCDGQVLVTHDMLGLTPGFVPSFVKQYAQLHTLMQQAVQQYIAEVKQSTFPNEEHSFT